MFVTQHRLVPVSFLVAQVRLVKLVEQGGLDAASWRAYEGQVGHFISVGPLGSVPGASKLLRVRFLDPVYRDDTMTIGLRWEAAGVAGGLFPVLDADLMVTGRYETTTRLELTGSYRPPLGGLGAGLDKAILGKVAALTVRAFLRDLAAGLVEPAPAAPRPGPASGQAPPLAAAPLAGAGSGQPRSRPVVTAGGDRQRRASAGGVGPGREGPSALLLRCCFASCWW